MRLTKDLVTALLLDSVGTTLLVLGILGYAGVLAALAEPAAYLTCGALGLAFTVLAIPSLLRAVRKHQAGRQAES
jgi:hypothetical protein